jgi:hypothetical protein
MMNKEIKKARFFSQNLFENVSFDFEKQMPDKKDLACIKR